MKNNLLLAILLGGASLEIQPVFAQTTPSSTSKKEMKRKTKARKQTGPEVYKGSVAEQSRVINDAAGAEKDREDNGEETSSKKTKRKN